MALLEILLEGDPRLRRKALRIHRVDDTLRRLAEDMYETMLAAPGVGLAAPQVGVLRRLIWVHVPENFHDEGGTGALHSAGQPRNHQGERSGPRL